MEFRLFLRTRRAELNLSQAALADRLTDLGQDTSPARISHREAGRNKPPLEDPVFRHSLSIALEMTTNDLMAALGYLAMDGELSNEAQHAAYVIDRLPDEARSLALEYLNLLEKRYMRGQEN